VEQQPRFGINYPNVVAEAFDGEWVIVNLDTGTYFSLEGSAAALWPHAIAGLTLEEFVDRAGQIYPAAGPELRQDVEGFHEQLRAHSLVRPVDAEPTTDVDVSPSSNDYAAPRMGVHADLQDILLLDPVHDVDAAGWPVAAPVDDDPSRSSSN